MARHRMCSSNTFIFSVPGRWQSKTATENVNTIDKRRSKIVRNRVFDCHLSPDWRQMAIEKNISNDFSSAFINC